MNKAKLVLLMMQHMLIVKIYQKELFHIKILKGRAYEIAGNRGYDRHQRVLASMIYKFLDKKTRSGASVNEQLAEESHKPVIK